MININTSSNINNIDYHKVYKLQKVNSADFTEKSTRDDLAISTDAKDFHTIKRMLVNSPDIREDKISEVKARLNSNNWNYSSIQIANKILSFS